MPLRFHFPALTALALILAPQAGLAQDAAAPAPTPALGETYLLAEHRDWQILCTQFEQDGPQICDMYQILLDPTGSPIAEISLAAFPPDNEIAAGATITTPLETFLPTGMAFRIDSGVPRFEGFRVCTQIGCVVRLALSPDEITMMRRGTAAFITIAPFMQIDQPVEIRVSLAGFSAAFDQLLTLPTFVQ